MKRPLLLATAGLTTLTVAFVSAQEPNPEYDPAAHAVFQPIESLPDRHPLRHTIHDRERPQPPKVDPGPEQPPAPVPSDARVLFDGSSFDAWQKGDRSEPGWKLVDDAMEVVSGTGGVQTKETFGDIQLHVEFRTAPSSEAQDQGRSNSGVFIGPYEVQVLDSHENTTYPDGMAGSLYGQYPPLVNASRPAGQWQTFDIVYRAPAFDDEGRVAEPAYFTVFHNGVLVQDHEPLVGPTSNGRRTAYSPHGDLPISLQDHGNPVRFRNIWVRELE